MKAKIIMLFDSAFWLGVTIILLIASNFVWYCLCKSAVHDADGYRESLRISNNNYANRTKQYDEYYKLCERAREDVFGKKK